MASPLVEKTRVNLQAAITEIWKISHDLNPSTLQDIGLADAVSQIIENINLAGKIRIGFMHSGFSQKNCLKEEDRIVVFRIIQEKLNHILKHSQAKSIYSSFIKGSKIELIMKDDGVGFDIAKLKKRYWNTQHSEQSGLLQQHL